MTTFDKSSNADKSFKQVANGLHAVPEKSPPAPAARTAITDVEIPALKARSLREKTQDEEQEQFEADAAAVLDSTAMAWAPTAQSSDVILAQAGAADGARTASDAAGANSGMKNIDWGVASNPSPAASGLASMWSGAALLGGLLVAGLGGGGGSKSDTKAPAETALKLTVQDGLIAGAKVYRDVKDDQHLVGTTDANGQLVLSKALTGSGVLIAVGGTNIDTGLANTLDLKISFSAGVSASTVMTPVTTLVTALLDSGVASIAAAETAVKQLLGLSMQLNLSTYDPMDAANAGSADALALRKAGAQIVQLATQLPNADQFFTALAKEVKTADSWGAMVQDEGFVSTLLADQLSQLSDEQRAELTASIVQDLTALGAVKTAGSLSAVQLNAAQLTVDLYQDTGTDRATQTDHITTNAQLAIRGYNTGAGYDSIEISLDLGKTWKTFEQAQFTPNGSVQDITVMVRQAGLTATQSDPLTFTWVSQAAQAPQLSLIDDTGTSGSDGITSNSQITLGQVSNPAIVVGNQTFQAQLEYSLNGDDFLPIPEGGLFNGLQGVLPDGHYDLQVRAYYPGLALESNPARLSFTLDTEAMVPQGYAITAVEGSFQDPDSTDRVFSAQGASSVLFTLNQAPEAGATVTLTIGQHSFDVLPDANGIWQASIPVEDLQPGTQTLSIHIVDAAGNTASADMPAFIFDNEAYAYVVGQDADGFEIVAAPDQIATLALESDSFLQDNVTNVTLPVFEGTAEADAVITLSIDGNTIGTGRANEAGAWRIAATAVLEEGEYIPVVTVTDVAGNVSDEFEGAAFTIVTTKPESSDVMLTDVDPSSDEELLALIEEVGLDISALTAPYTDSAAVSAAGITFELTSLDTGSDNADGITMFPLPRINGTVSGSGDLLVFVSLRDISTDVEPTELVKFAPITAVDGEWSVQVTQPLGAEGESHTYVPYITVMDGAGNITRTTGAPIVIDRQAPEEATAELVHDEDNDTGIDATDGLTANFQPMLQGTAEAGATVVIDVMADGTLVYTATVESDGTWTVQVEDDLPEGEWTPQITVIDLAGNVSAPIDAEVSFTVDATPPDAPAFNAFGDTEGNGAVTLDDAIVTKNNAPTLSGTAEEGSFVTVTVGDWVSEPIEAVGGEWSITVDELADGEYTPEVVAVDAAGNESEAVLGETFKVLTLPPDVGNLSVGLKHDSASDTGLDAEDNITNSAELQIEGTAPEGMRVVVELDGTVYGLDEEIIADADGNWSVTITDLPEGEYTPVARLVDVVGNESENVEGTPFTVDLTPPEDVTANLTHDEANDTGTDAEDNITNNVAPMISGTAEAGALVTVTVGDWMTDEPVQVGEDGTWSVTVGVDLEDGEYAPVVTVADVAGNLLEEFEGETFTVKTTIEAPAMNAFGDTEGNDTGALTDDFVTSNNAPTLSGTAEEGSFVTVTVGDWVSEPIEAVGGEWSITVDELADGEYTPEVVAVDAAGNESEAVTGETFTVDTEMSEEPTLAEFSDIDGNETGVSLTDRITNNVAPVFEGQAEALAWVTLVIQQQDDNSDWTVVQEMDPIQADDTGYWTASLNEDLLDGTYRAVVKAADMAGNESAEVQGPSFTVDTLAPVLPQQLTPHIVSINTSMNYQPTAGAGVHVVSMEDATGTLPEGLTIDDASYQLTGLTEVAGFTWLSAIMADEAGNESALPVYQPLIFVSDIRPTTQTINHTSAAAAKLYQGTNGDDVGFSLFKAPGDVLLTKEGDDLVTVSSADGLGFAYVDGGAGVDTMKFTVADIAMDFSQFNNSGTGQLLKDFEIFQFTGRDASVSISAQDIFGLSSQVFGANFVYNLRIDGASGNQSASLTDLEARTKIVTDRDGYEEEVNETFDATGSQSNSGKYHKYSGFFTDELEVDRLVTLLIDKSFVV
ncbi:MULTISPECIES: Ig-like domain-containing protein [unclassified Limnohabitans]|uniref:Ig-like domain-containing protein n=1 Tax=unclassified Limnohabitans TaxID=2626134 RepID=UPI0011B280BB|nr:MULTISPECIES: Ig-like domain-containing protein [unclassified Limnohabitans]